jgi:nucleotide-binding universal stress UspA family protein
MILVASDFSAGADGALVFAIELARRLDESIEICHVHPLRSAPVPPTLELAVTAPAATAVATAEMALADRVERCRKKGVRCEGHSRFGLPASEVLARVVESSPRMVVVGRRGAHGPLQHLLVGSVAEEITNHAGCPTVVVPTPPT